MPNQDHLDRLQSDLLDVASALSAEYPDIGYIACCYIPDGDTLQPRVIDFHAEIADRANSMLEALGWTLHFVSQERAMHAPVSRPHPTAHARIAAIRRVETALINAALEKLSDD